MWISTHHFAYREIDILGKGRFVTGAKKVSIMRLLLGASLLCGLVAASSPHFDMSDLSSMRTQQSPVENRSASVEPVYSESPRRPKSQNYGDSFYPLGIENGPHLSTDELNEENNLSFVEKKYLIDSLKLQVSDQCNLAFKAATTVMIAIFLLLFYNGLILHVAFH